MGARAKSVLSDAEQVQLAAELAALGARLQVLETETDSLPRAPAQALQGSRGVSPPKGMLPFSTDWFMSWMPNIHASIFMNIHNYLRRHTASKVSGRRCAPIGSISSMCKVNGLERVLSFTRAWSLLRFVRRQAARDGALHGNAADITSCMRWICIRTMCAASAMCPPAQARRAKLAAIGSSRSPELGSQRSAPARPDRAGATLPSPRGM